MESVSIVIITVLISYLVSSYICFNFLKKIETEWQRVFDEVTKITLDEIKKYMHD